MHIKRMGKLLDLTGKRFGHLVVTRRGKTEPLTPSGGGTRVFWTCRCDCGTEKDVVGHKLREGGVRSCGCQTANFVSERSKTHGHSTRRNGVSGTYYSWFNMLTRCRNPNYRYWHRYGGRGITVCDRWLKFENFLADMGERPDKLTIERNNNNGNYEPGNCRWATRFEQGQNRG